MNNDFLIRAMMSKLVADSKFVGIFMMATGALVCLTIVAMPIGIPIIFAGMRAKEAGTQMGRFIFSSDVNDKLMAYENYQKHFYIQKVLMIISISLLILALILLFGMIISLLGSMLKMGGH